MNKKTLSFVGFFVPLSLLLFASTSFASEKTFLNSTSTSVKEFDEVKLEKFIDDEGEEGYEIIIEDEVEEDGIEGYSIMVDVEKGTYDTEQLSEEELLAEYQEVVDMGLGEEELLLQDYQTSRAISGGIKTAFLVQAFTRDPPKANLTRTSNKLTWKYNGVKADKYSRVGSCVGFAPTILGTNWYTSSCVKSEYSIINNGKHVTNRVRGQYYNWDFGNKNKKTNAGHNIYIRGSYQGKANYTATFSKSGEGSSLLHFKVLTVKSGS